MSESTIHLTSLDFQKEGKTSSEFNQLSEHDKEVLSELLYRNSGMDAAYYYSTYEYFFESPNSATEKLQKQFILDEDRKIIFGGVNFLLESLRSSDEIVVETAVSKLRMIKNSLKSIDRELLLIKHNGKLICNSLQ